MNSRHEWNHKSQDINKPSNGAQNVNPMEKELYQSLH